MYSVMRRISPVPMRHVQTGLVICDVFFFDVCGRLVVWDGERAWAVESRPQSTVYTLVDESGNRMSVDIRSSPISIGDVGVAIAVLRTAARRAVDCALRPQRLAVDDDAVVVQTDGETVRLPRMASAYATDSDHVVLDAEAYISTGDAARMLAVSDDTVRRLIKRGALEAVATQGGHYRISRRSVVQYATNRSDHAF
jgi:excisionase family DNA binding protein